MLDFITWNVSPILAHFKLPFIGEMEIRYYGVLFTCCFIFGYLVMGRVYKKEGRTIEELDRLSVSMIIGIVLGARLGHVLFYDPVYYFHNPIEIIQIWKGGLASHGAAIGTLITLYLYSRKLNIYKPFLWILDRISIVVCLGGFFVRMGNLMNSEIYGKATSLPWGFVFVRDMDDSVSDIDRMMPHHPTQIYEGLSYLAMFVFFWVMYNRRTVKMPRGRMFGLFLIMLWSARFLIEFIKNVQEPWEAKLPLDLGQLLSIPFIIIGIIILRNSYKPNMMPPVEEVGKATEGTV